MHYEPFKYVFPHYGTIPINDLVQNMNDALYVKSPFLRSLFPETCAFHSHSQFFRRKSNPDSFTMLCTHPPAVNMFQKYVEEQQDIQQELHLIVQMCKTMLYEVKNQLPPGSVPLFSPH